MGNFMNLGQKIEVKSMQKKRERGFLCLFKKNKKLLHIIIFDTQTTKTKLNDIDT